MALPAFMVRSHSVVRADNATLDRCNARHKIDERVNRT